MCRILFEIIDNLFMYDLFKNLNPGYSPPSRTTLSSRLLDQEVARISQNIEKELELSDHLTLSMNFFIFYLFFYIFIDFLIFSIRWMDIKKK